MKVLNYGSLNLDYVYKVDHAVQPGETLAACSLESHLGGKGLNQSIAMANAGIEVWHAGKVGNDSTGSLLLSACKALQIDITCIASGEEASGHAIIQVDRNGSNCILIFGGSNRRLERSEIDAALSRFEKGDFLVLQNEVNQLDYIIEKAAERELVIVLNPSPYDERIEQCDLAKVSYLVLNEIEAGQMTGKYQENEMLDEMLKRFPDMRIVLTLGEKGAIFRDRDGISFQEAFKTDPVDTTAAGDTFTGYFIAGIIQGCHYQDALRMAAQAAAIAVSRHGASDSIPKMDEVIRMLERYDDNRSSENALSFTGAGKHTR